MDNKLRRYVDGIFEDTTPTRKAVELKEEMIQNLEDKYKDLIAEGKTAEAAYNIAVAGIGDVSGLLDELERELKASPWLRYENENAHKKSAMLTSVAVMLYILSILPLIIFEMFGSRAAEYIGLPAMLIIIAAATGLLVYNNMTKPKYSKEDHTMVEEFREWKSDNKGRKSMRGAISSAIWSLILAAYFIVSFTTGAWHLTWIMFILGGVVESIISIILNLRK